MRTLAVLGLLLVGAGLASAQVPETAPDDGDAPLPKGALARIGTTRLRHIGPITQMAFSSDSRNLASCGYDCVLRCWDPASAKQLWAGAASRSEAFAFSPHGATLAASANLSQVRLWNVRTGTHIDIPLVKDMDSVKTRTLAFGPDGKRVVLVDDFASAVTYEIASRKVCLTEFLGHDNRRGSNIGAVFSADARFVAECREIWRIDTRKKVGTLPGNANVAALSPDGCYAATREGHGQFHIWQVASLERHCSLTATGNHTLTFAPDNRTVATAGGDGSKVRLFDLATGKQRHLLRHGTTTIGTVAFSPDTRLLATGSEAGVIRLWDIATGKERLLLSSDLEAPMGLAWPAQRGSLAVQAARGVHFFDLASGATSQSPWKVNRRRLVPIGHVEALAPNAGLALAVQTNAAGFDQAYLWDVDRGARLHRLTAVDRPADCWHAVFAPGAGVVAVTGASDMAGDDAVWETGTGKRLWQLPKKPAVRACGFSRDGKVLITSDLKEDAAASLPARHKMFINLDADTLPQMRFWDVTTGKEIRCFPVPEEMGPGGDAFPLSAPSHVETASNSRLLAMTGVAHVRVLDALTGKVLLDLPRQGPFTFSPDGRVLATGNDPRVELWELATGKRFAELRGHSGPVRELLFAADGRTLASSSADHTVLIWDVRPQCFGAAAARLDPDALARCWRDLAGADSLAASLALAKLARVPR